MIEIPRTINKRDYLIVVTNRMLNEYHVNYSEDLLGEFMTDERIDNEIREWEKDDKIRVPNEVYQKINELTEDDVKQYIDKMKSLQRGYENNFTYIIKENQDIFDKFLTVEQNGYNKQNCKELLIESIAIFKTPYNDEFYIKTDAIHYRNIGNNYTQVYDYYKNLYDDVPKDLQRYIPFSSFCNPSKIKTRTFESLEPNRHIILFDDCILDVSSGKERPYEVITRDIIPFSVIRGEYKVKNEICYEFIRNIINKLIEEPNILKSILYSLINKDELIKSAIFNIQKSGKGKSMLLDPFKQIGILETTGSATLYKTLEKEVLFKQKLIVNFEEIQDANIVGSEFNSLVDDSAITVPRKNRTAIEVPAYIKPTIIINGEDLPNFKGRTRGTLNRFSLVPKFIDVISVEEAEFIRANGHQVGIELLRYLMLFKMNTTKEQRKEWLMTCKITEQQYLELRENKSRIIFDYIEDTPQLKLEKQAYCVSIKILTEMIIYLQDTNILTVYLFNNERAIKQFINKDIIGELDILDEYKSYMNEPKIKKVKRNTISKTHKLKYCLQLTKSGIELVTELGYDIDSLRI